MDIADLIEPQPQTHTMTGGSGGGDSSHAHSRGAVGLQSGPSAAVVASLPAQCLSRLPLSCQQRDAHLLPSLCSLLSSSPCALLFSYWLDGQLLGTFHTVELASHLVLFGGRSAPTITYACELYQSYCTSESPYPVACEVRPETLEHLFSVLEEAQHASAAKAAPAAGEEANAAAAAAAAAVRPLQPTIESGVKLHPNLFDGLLDELLLFLLPHFLFYLHSSDCTYSGVERILLASSIPPPASSLSVLPLPGLPAAPVSSSAAAGPSALLFSVCKSRYFEELPLFVLDFHAFRRRLTQVPAKLIQAVKQSELEKKARASQTASMQAALEDGYELDSGESSWALSAKHQRLIDQDEQLALLIPRPVLPMTPPTPGLQHSHMQPAHVSIIHLPSFVAARLHEIQLLYEKYLAPSSSAQKHLLHSALVALTPKLLSTTSILATGTQMSQPHPLARRAEFALRDLPYYLLRNFLDQYHMASKYNFIGSDLLNSLHAIALWCVRDMELRKHVLRIYAEELHFGLGRELGLAHGVDDSTASAADGFGHPSHAFVPPHSALVSSSSSAIGNLRRLPGTSGPPSRVASPDFDESGGGPRFMDEAVTDALNAKFHLPERRRARSETEMAALEEWWRMTATGAPATQPNSPVDSPGAATRATMGAAMEQQQQQQQMESFSSTTTKYQRAHSRGGSFASFVPIHAPQPTAALAMPPTTPDHAGGSTTGSALSPSPAHSTRPSSSILFPSSPPALLPALPFLPPQRSFHFATVALYRKHVLLGVRKRMGKEENEMEARNGGGSASGLTGNGSGGGGGLADSPADAQAAREARRKAQGKQLMQLSLSNPTHDHSTSNSPTLAPLGLSASPSLERLNLQRGRIILSADDLDVHALHHARTASEAMVEEAERSAHAEQQRALLLEQMQSMRHILDEPAPQPMGHTNHDPHVLSVSHSAPPSPAHHAPPASGSPFSLHVTPHSSLVSPPQAAGSTPSTSHAIAPLGAIGTPRTRSRSVRFSAHARHEVREFDSEDQPIELSAGTHSPASSPTANATAAVAGGSVVGKPLPHPSVPGGVRGSGLSTLASTNRSILKHHSGLSDDFSSSAFSPSMLHSPQLAPRHMIYPASHAHHPAHHHPHQPHKRNGSHLSPPVPQFALLAPSPTPGGGAGSAHGNSVTLKPHPSYFEAMKKIYEQRQAETARLLNILSKGAVFLKYQSTSASSDRPAHSGVGSGGPHSFAKFVHTKSDYRFFRIDSPVDASELTWCKLVNTTKEGEAVITLHGQRKKPQRESVFHKHRTRLLADGLRLFADSFHSPLFAAYNASPNPSPPWLGLTLLFTDRSLDLVAMDEQQAMDWYFGLQALIPLNPSFKTKPLYLWARLRMKIQFYAKAKGIPVASYCKSLLNQARIAAMEAEIKHHHQQAHPPAGTSAEGAHHLPVPGQERGRPSSTPSPSGHSRRSSPSTQPTRLQIAITTKALAANSANLEVPSPRARIETKPFGSYPDGAEVPGTRQ